MSNILSIIHDMDHILYALSWMAVSSQHSLSTSDPLDFYTFSFITQNTVRIKEEDVLDIEKWHHFATTMSTRNVKY